MGRHGVWVRGGIPTFIYPERDSPSPSEVSLWKTFPR